MCISLHLLQDIQVSATVFQDDTQEPSADTHNLFTKVLSEIFFMIVTDCEMLKDMLQRFFFVLVIQSNDTLFNAGDCQILGLELKS